MITVINYGLGNLHSVEKAIAYAGGDAKVTDDPEMILKADKVVLPGVGAFADGMKGLAARGVVSSVKETALSGKPLLGICLGMQLFFEASEEDGHHEGLGLLKGKVKAFDQPGIKIPQIGWNQLEIDKPSRLMQEIQQGSYVYFNHGYYCIPEDVSDILTTTWYGVRFASTVQRENVIGVQFHPEKSQQIGLKIIRNFVEL
ncbi:MAG: imidazole glycerol phosphate synthase subunit HisH [Anaerolineales bacterium]|nr:imidazole glycerol phosphate synthase subunit HisH [Anaerolineales bacterium]